MKWEFWLLAGLLLLTPHVVEAKRVALIIANARYDKVPALKNPAADAKLIAGVLTRAGFDSVEVKNDLDKRTMEASLQQFSRRADGADVALIYFAGHGIEAGGQNYLIPADAALVQDRDLELEATRLETVLAMGEGAKMRIVILDACRNNPFAASMARTIRQRSIGRGLAAIEPEGETLVVYAAKAGAFAEDGSGANSPFASALAKRLPEPGLEIGLLFRAVRDDVLEATGNGQEPFTYGSLSGRAFYFVPGAGGARPPVVATSVVDRDALAWQGALAAGTVGGYREYLRAYPKGAYAELARQNLAKLTAPAAPAPQPRPQLAMPSLPPGFGGRTGGSLPESLSDYDMTGLLKRPVKLGGLSRAALARPGQDPTRGHFSFYLTPRIRSEMTRGFFANMRENAPAMAAAIAPGTDDPVVFSDYEDQLEPSTLTPDNVADAFARLIVTTLTIQTGGLPTSRAALEQTRAVSQQVAAILIEDPNFRSLREAEKQIISDTAWLNIWIIEKTITSSVVSDPKKRQGYARDMAEGLAKNFGVDVTKFRLTDRGLVPK